MSERSTLSAGSSVELFQALSQLARGLLAPDKDPGPVFQLVVRHAAASLQGDAASLYLVGADGDYELAAVHGRPFERRRIPKDQGVVGEVGRSRFVVAIEDIREDPRYKAVGSAHREGFVSMVAAPLVAEDELLGVLGVYWTARRSPSAAERELAQLFAHHAAAAIALARLVAQLDRANRQLREANEKIAEAALRDPLTGLFNRGAFWSALERLTGELAGPPASVVAARIPLPSPPVAVFMIDLNGFKEINDVYGHLTGDAVLQEVAALLQGFCPPPGLVARYGGDEFGVVVGLEAQPPEQFARRVQEVVAGHTFGGGQRLAAPSVGYAVYPREARTAWQLVALADTRMYEKKTTRKGYGHG